MSTSNTPNYNILRRLHRDLWEANPTVLHLCFLTQHLIFSKLGRLKIIVDYILYESKRVILSAHVLMDAQEKAGGWNMLNELLAVIYKIFFVLQLHFFFCRLISSST